MNALELAEYFENDADGSVSDSEVAYTLRRQHEAIVKLRIALHECTNDVYLPPILRRQVMDALSDTGDLSNEKN